MTGDKVKPSVKITLDKERKLKLDLNAMIAYEEATGKSFLKGTVDLENLELKEMRTLLWAMLLSDDPSLTQAQVGAMIDASNMQQLAADLAEGIKLSMPVPQDEATRPLVQSPQPG
jgi:hypothetical protein